MITVTTKWKVILLLLMLCVNDIHAQEAFSGYEVAREGAWCWFADPRATHYEDANAGVNVSWIGYIDVHGSIKAMQMDFVTGRKNEVLVQSNFQPDDHNNPTFLVLPDGRVMIFYMAHTSEPRFYYRISVRPYDITQLGAEKVITVANNTTYPSPFILSEDPTHIYLCWRGINWHPTIGRLTMPDGNDDCTFDFGPKQIVQSTAARPYVKYQSNGKDKIYLTYTTGHPDNEYPNWVYFNTIDINAGGTEGPILRDVKGNQLSVIGNGPFYIYKTSNYKNSYPLTVVDAPSSYRDWIWQIATDSADNPVVAMVRINNAKTDHEYYYARWTGNEWKLTDIGYGGRSFHGQNRELCYSSGIAIDPDTVNNVYVSLPTANASGTNVYEIWKYVLDDTGNITDKQQLTKNSQKNNVRPFILPGSAKSPLRLCWMYGDYVYWFKTYPTELHSDWKLPEDAVDLDNGLLKKEAGNSLTMTESEMVKVFDGTGSGTFSVSISPVISTDPYSGELLHIGSNIMLGLNADHYLYVKLNGTTYTSATPFYTADTPSSYYNFPITKPCITLTYDGSRLVIYRNHLIEMIVDSDGLTLGDVSVGGFCGSVDGYSVYNRAISQDEVRRLVVYSSLAQISIPNPVTTDIVLPTSISSGAAISWTSSDGHVLSNDGIDHYPATATDVTLTAVSGTDTLKFQTTVLPRDITNNLMLRYDFETDETYVQDGVTQVRDLSGNGRDLAVMGKATVDGTLNTTQNTATGFSTNGYALAPSHIIDSLRSYTVLLQATPKSLEKLPRFYDFGVGANNSFFLRANALSAGIKYNGGSTTLVTASTTLTTGTTYNVAVTFNAADHLTTIYIDGDVVASGTNNICEPYQLTANGTDLRNYIARTQWWQDNSDNADYIGTIDNFRLYNIALTQNELATLQGYDVHEGDSALIIDYTDSIANPGFESSYKTMENSGVTSDRAIYLPEGWDANYQNGNENDMSILNPTDLYGNLFTAPLNARTGQMGANTYLIRQKWGTSSIGFNQSLNVLPAGAYELIADVWYSGGTGSSQLLVTPQQSDAQTLSVTTSSTKWQTQKLPFTLNGFESLYLGFCAKKLTNGTESFSGFDNFCLRDVTALKTKSALLSLLTDILSAAKSRGDATDEALTIAISAAGKMSDSNTWDEVYAAYIALRDAIANPGTSDAIHNVTDDVESSSNSVFYDLNGRQVRRSDIVHGIYIEKKGNTVMKSLR